MAERRSIFITGGASGIGRAIARHFGARGWFIGIADVNVAGMEDTLGLIEGGFKYMHRLDVRDRAAWDEALAAFNTAAGSRIDVVVNNAGIGVAGNIETCTFEDWQRCFDINVNSIFHGCQKALPLMREHAPGSIINISSIAGLIASDTMPAYNASKAAVWMLSKSIALHCAKKQMNIRCNSVHPTFVDTPILDGTAKAASLDKGVLLEKLARQIPLKFVGEPNDIANAVLYLASDESRFMTGAELKLDGGISAM
jgi:NAD(P)-dependent dehydrogenase (short-subunit alcohol dehydrogenase family)